MTQDNLYKQIRDEVATPSVFKVIARPIITVIPHAEPQKSVSVECPYASIGTVFAITSDGYALTASHVVDTTEDYDACLKDLQKKFTEKKLPLTHFDWKGSAKYVVTNAVGQTFEMKVIFADDIEKSDQALVFITPKLGQSFKPLLFSHEKNLSDQSVAIIGSPVGVDNVISIGKIARKQLHEGTYRLLVAPVYPGNSGGPAITLFDMKVVGMIDQILLVGHEDGMTEIARLVPSENILTFLKKHLPERTF